MGRRPAEVPGWFSAAFPSSYRAAHLFDDHMSSGLGLAPGSAMGAVARPSHLVEGA